MPTSLIYYDQYHMVLTFGLPRIFFIIFRKNIEQNVKTAEHS